ncbi:unnamed protein product [Boreogadus saida]
MMLPRPGEEAVCGALGLQRPFPWPSEQITTVMSGDQASVLFRNKKVRRSLRSSAEWDDLQERTAGLPVFVDLTEFFEN